MKSINMHQSKPAATLPDTTSLFRQRTAAFTTTSFEATHHVSGALALALLALLVGSLCAASPALQVRPPALDEQGRFWVYRNGLTKPRMPFTPYGWMSDGTNLARLIQIDLESRERPNTASKSAVPTEREYCIRVKITWDGENWASVAFIAGPDKPPWWGETNGGTYYNLADLPKKKLVFFARGERGDERIKAQIGVLGNRPFGDSLIEPIVSNELKLTKDWARYEVDLKEVPPAELARICNGFGIIAEREGQGGTSREMQFYIDDVYLE
jgi:hypothetical protein